MKRIAIMSFVGVALNLSGYFVGRFWRLSPQPVVSAIIKAAYADTNVSLVQVSRYKGEHEYVLVRTINEIPKKEIQSQLFRVYDKGISLRMMKNWSIDSTELKIEGESKLRIIEGFGEILMQP